MPSPQPVPEGAAPSPDAPLAERPPKPPEISIEPPPQRPAVVSTPPPPPPTPEPDQPEPTAAEVPQLGVILSDEEKRSLEAAIDDDIRRTNSILGRARFQELDADQKAAYRRIRQFLEQVEENRDEDAALARNLASRARVLAEDLGRNFR